jgi:hypothetical protein
MAGDRSGSRQEPRFEFPLGQDDAECGAVLVGIEQDEDFPGPAGLAGSQLDRAFQLALLQQSLAVHPDRSRHFRGNVRRDHAGDPSDEDRHGLDLGMAFDNRDEPHQRSGLPIEEHELLRKRKLRVGPELVHPEQFARSVEMVAQN